LPAIVYGYNSTNASIPSIFSTKFLVKGDGTGSSAAINFSTAPYTIVSNQKYFIFVLDIQEPGSVNSYPIQIDNITISLNGVNIWKTTQAMQVNNVGTAITPTPRGNGADMAFYVPVSIFNGRGLTGASTFIFTASHSNTSGGSEEWQFTDKGIPTGITFYSPTDPIFDPGVPELSTWALALIGGSFLVFRCCGSSSRILKLKSVAKSDKAKHVAIGRIVKTVEPKGSTQRASEAGSRLLVTAPCSRQNE